MRPHSHSNPTLLSLGGTILDSGLAMVCPLQRQSSLILSVHPSPAFPSQAQAPAPSAAEGVTSEAVGGGGGPGSEATDTTSQMTTDDDEMLDFDDLIEGTQSVVSEVRGCGDEGLGTVGKVFAAGRGDKGDRFRGAWAPDDDLPLLLEWCPVYRIWMRPLRRRRSSR